MDEGTAENNGPRSAGERPGPGAPSPEVVAAVGCLGTPAVCIMTASFEDARTGVRVLSVQQCATEPVLLCVAVRKGHSIEPLIRDSHHFGLCIVKPDDRLVIRKFPEDPHPEAEDPFDAFTTLRFKSTAPIIGRSIAAFDCEVVRHFDLEADHELYVGMIHEARVLNG